MSANILLKAEQTLRALQLFAGTLTEAQALEVASIYPEWTASTAYAVGDVISYGTNPVGDPQLYKVVQAHTSQADWTPDATPALYDAFGLDDSGHTLWAQPSGAHDVYQTGDIVNYNGTLYKSLIDGNVWAPDVYPAGWELYQAPTEPDPGPGPGPEPGGGTASYPEWVQPSGAQDAYKTGDIVSYNGKLYRSTIDNNVWSPDAYPTGWEEYAGETV